jgi:hypothetical protein
MEHGIENHEKKEAVHVGRERPADESKNAGRVIDGFVVVYGGENP